MKTQLFGYSPFAGDDVMEHVKTAPGDWVAVRQDSEGTTIASAPVGAIPYFYCHAGGRFVHGSDLFAVARSAGLPWRWNQRAIRCLGWLGYTVGTDTLHPQVFRVPSASIVRGTADGVVVTGTGWWQGLFSGKRTTTDDAVTAIEAAVAELPKGRLLVSLSGGYDSRVLLAAALASGRDTVVATMGFEDSSDRVVATEIARRTGLQHYTFELSGDDYLAHGPRITRLTGGTKLAANWHTYLYARNLRGIQHAAHLVGSNGEFARSFFFNYGSASTVASLMPAPMMLTPYFTARVEKRRRMFPMLESSSGDSWRLGRHLGSLAAGPANALNALDYYYATQRVRQFIGTGIALFATTTKPMSPFLDGRWIRAIARLPRSSKLAASFHIAALRKLYPDLAEVPMGAADGKGYSPWAQVAMSAKCRATVVDSPYLDEFASRVDRELIFDRRDLASIDLLVTLHFAGEAAVG